MERLDTAENTILQIKITLRHIRPPIWRRVLVSPETHLDRLHGIIQAAMGWENYHMHEFMAQGISYGIPDPELGFENERLVTIAEVLGETGAKMSYEYDFGDGWEHEVLLEKALPQEEGTIYPVCIKGKRACPPEDCGGSWGYMELLDALADPEHPEHETLTEWVGGRFDPEAFDLDATNAALREDRAPGSEANQVGKQPPRYAFVLNPYQDVRFSTCPDCDGRTLLRKHVLLVEILGVGWATANQACRFCEDCDLIIAHQDELEQALSEHLQTESRPTPDLPYRVTGTVDRSAWRKAVREQTPTEQLFEHAADFAAVLEVIVTPGGWYPSGSDLDSPGIPGRF